MAGFANLKTALEARIDGGKKRWAPWHKTPSQATTAGIWFDLSLSPGNPPPIYYAGAPLTTLAIARSTDGGLQHGNSVSSASKYLGKFLAIANAATALPMPMILVDLLMCYPFIDESTNDPQATTASTTIPRYTDGAGVQVMAVSVAPPSGVGGPTFNFSYTNSAGVSGRTSQTVTMNTATLNGQILTSLNTTTSVTAVPFIPLQVGDSGVRSIESVTMVSGSDVGLFTLVLVKPLLDTQILGIDAPMEQEPYIYKSEMFEVKDDACLSLICCPNGALNATRLMGSVEFIWT
jgi:hypothetical protein